MIDGGEFMKKIFLIFTLFFMFCVNVFAYPSDFFKSYPNGSIEVKIDWGKGEGYYNAVFYDDNGNKKNDGNCKKKLTLILKSFKISFIFITVDIFLFPHLIFLNQLHQLLLSFQNYLR